MPSIWILVQTKSNNPVPIEINVDLLNYLQSKFFNLKMDTVNSPQFSSEIGKRVYYLYPNKTSIVLSYNHPKINVKHKDYISKQKIWIPFYNIQERGKNSYLKWL